MRVSGFTFVRNGERYGYPFVESIRSILPIVDEFIVALGPSEDRTEEMLRGIGDPKIRILPTQWNDALRPNARVKGFVYGQQKSTALFSCTGDWAFYLEGDEIVHEQDLFRIRAAMERYLDDPRVESLIFDYLHFYGNGDTVAWSPGWYRTAPRIIRNTIPVWAPKGLFFLVLRNHKCGRYPRAAHTGAVIYHYGWVRPEESVRRKNESIARHWRGNVVPVDYADVDERILQPFRGTHPAVIRDWLPPSTGLFRARPGRRPTLRERKHRLMLLWEKLFGGDLSKKHYRLVYPRPPWQPVMPVGMRRERSADAGRFR